MKRIFGLAASILMIAFLAACDDEEPAPAPTSTSTAPASVTATASAPATASVTATASPSVTASATPTAFPTGPAGPTPPAGYAASCAAAYPWGKQVTKAFVCIEQPVKGASVNRGSVLTVRGYAGGSFENNVVVEVRTVGAGGSAAAGTLVQMPVTYVAPDSGMPGFWQALLPIPAGQPSDARVIAHFESPKDGARVAEASVEISLR